MALTYRPLYSQGGSQTSNALSYRPLGSGASEASGTSMTGGNANINRAISEMKGGNWLQRTLAPTRESTLNWSARNPWFENMLEPLGIKEQADTRSSPYRWLRTMAQPNVSAALKPVIGEDLSRKVGYGARGMMNIPTYATDPKFAWNTLKGQRPTDRYEATTDSDKIWERGGQALMGQILAAGVPLAALPGKATMLGKMGMTGTQVLKAQAGAVAMGGAQRGLMGATLGAGFGAVGLAKDYATTGKLPDKEQVINAFKQGAASGIENSWMLAFTDLATDKVLGVASKALSKSHPSFSKMLGGMTQAQTSQAMKPLKDIAGLGAPGIIKSKLFARGTAKYFARALLEVPAEDAMWTAMNQLKGQEQRNFAQAWVQDLPETTLGNLMYAGGQTFMGGGMAIKGTDFGDIVKSAKKSLAQTKATAGAQPGGLEAGFAKIPGGELKTKADVQKFAGSMSDKQVSDLVGKIEQAVEGGDDAGIKNLYNELGIPEKQHKFFGSELSGRQSRLIATTEGDIFPEQWSEKQSIEEFVGRMSDEQVVDIAQRAQGIGVEGDESAVASIYREYGVPENKLVEMSSAINDRYLSAVMFEDTLGIKGKKKPGGTGLTVTEIPPGEVTKISKDLGGSKVYKVTGKTDKYDTFFVPKTGEIYYASGDEKYIPHEVGHLAQASISQPIRDAFTQEFETLSGKHTETRGYEETFADVFGRVYKGTESKSFPRTNALMNEFFVEVLPKFKHGEGLSVPIIGGQPELKGWDRAGKAVRSPILDEALAGDKPVSGTHYSHTLDDPSQPTPKEFELAKKTYKAEAKESGMEYYAVPEMTKTPYGHMEHIFVFNDAEAKSILSSYGIEASPKYFLQQSMRTNYVDGTPEKLALTALYGLGEQKAMLDIADTAYTVDKGEVIDIVNKYNSARTLSESNKVKAEIHKRYGLTESEDIEEFMDAMTTRYNGLSTEDMGRYEPVDDNSVRQQALLKPGEAKPATELELKQARATVEAIPDENPAKEILTSILEEVDAMQAEGKPIRPGYIESINIATNQLGQGEGLDALKFSVEWAKQYPELADKFTKGKPTSWEEWDTDLKGLADADAVPLETREQTTKLMRDFYALRNRHAGAVQALESSGILDTPAKLDKSYELMNQVAKDSTGVSNRARSIAQQLNALKNQTQPGKVKTILEMAIKEMDKAGVTAEEYKKAFKGVDMTNKGEVIKATRKIAPPSLTDVLYEFRYTNLLSSPKTHSINFFSNAIQAFVTEPGRKLFSGLIDPLYSQLTSKQREHYVSEVPAYYKGLFASLTSGKAMKAFGDAYSGKEIMQRPDVAAKQTMGEKAKLEGWKKIFEPANLAMSVVNKYFGTGGKIVSIPRGLEAFDAFWQTVIKEGAGEAMIKAEVNKNPGVDVDKLKLELDDPNSLMSKNAIKYAQESIFRGELDTSGQKRGQGYLLRGIDEFTSGLYNFREKPLIGWLFKGYIPFIKTPMEILKQGIEYSPAGLITTFGAKDVADQLGKSAMGSVVMAVSYALASQGDVTWAAPKGEKQRQRFYASGRKPYSIRIGDKWISYSRIGVLAYPIAWAAAIKWHTDNNPKNMTNSKLQGVGQATASMMKFFSDQSYMTGLSDLINLISGVEGAGSRALTNIPRQMIPLTSLQGWVSRLLDPIYRNPQKSLSKNMMANIMYYNYAVDPYKDPLGNPSTRGDFIERLANSLLPWGVTPAETAFFETYFQLHNKKDEANRIKTAVKDGKMTPEQGAELLAELIKEINAGDTSLSQPPEAQIGMEGGAAEQATRQFVGADPTTGTQVPALPIPGFPIQVGGNQLPGGAITPTSPTRPSGMTSPIPPTLNPTPAITTPSQVAPTNNPNRVLQYRPLN